jgi:hypothetical protein
MGHRCQTDQVRGLKELAFCGLSPFCRHQRLIAFLNTNINGFISERDAVGSDINQFKTNNN